MTVQKTAMVIGATGLIGNACVMQLLQSDDYSQVVVLSRKALVYTHPKLRVQLIDFDHIETHSNSIIADEIFYCLGTTIKKAGSQAAFYKIDFEYAMQIAQIAEQNKISQFLLVSSLGADPNSNIFYSRTKGALEAALKRLAIPSIHIFQPSILLGDRTESRTGEGIGKILAQLVRPLLIGGLRKYRAIAGTDVAKAMIRIAQQQKKGIYTYPSDQIQELANA